MLRTWTGSAFLVFVMSLQACTGSAPGWRISPGDNPSAIPKGALDFSWRLSGDRAVAPMQVFSDATHTWLQWQPGQPLPAIFGFTEAGEKLVSYERQGPYTRLEGAWTRLVFRGAHQQAQARRILSPVTGQASAVNPDSSSHSAPPEAVVVAAVPVKSVSPPFYAVIETDVNLRQALARWAGLSGWRFQAEHWAVDVDIPLTATANFSDDFVSSVRALIEATELSDRPLQPCFYANQVLRVVPLAEACDRTLVDGVRA
ncbi:MAG: TcpQ domain-containing protein [Burkholderiaceae bacterium]|nr:TcpQ domain-containing protein [Burkholderiaceae bacterium]